MPKPITVMGSKRSARATSTAGERQGGEAGGGDQPADEAATRLVVSAVEHIDRDHQHHAEENPREGGEDQ